MGFVDELKNKVLSGKCITRNEGILLYNEPLEELSSAANEIREKFCGNGFDICTIVNGKSGRCSENCKYCAQSACYNTDINEYGLLSVEEIVKQAEYNAKKGVVRYSIVCSGRKLSDSEVEKMCDAVKAIKERINISVCVSFGLLSEENFRKLKSAGVSRVHNNIETSRRNFPNVCTTHSFDDKLQAIQNAKNAGLSVCSGGIMGLGETVEDRVDMAFTLNEIGITSVPVNRLNPIKGTPYENNTLLTKEDMERIVAVFRFIMPKAYIRLAGGRYSLEDFGKGCFTSGANAAISGDMLTTAGVGIAEDMDMLNELGYRVQLCDGE